MYSENWYEWFSGFSWLLSKCGLRWAIKWLISVLDKITNFTSPTPLLFSYADFLSSKCLRPVYPSWLCYSPEYFETKPRFSWKKSIFLHGGIKVTGCTYFLFLIYAGQQIFSSNSHNRDGTMCSSLANQRWNAREKGEKDKERKKKVTRRKTRKEEGVIRDAIGSTITQADGSAFLLIRYVPNSVWTIFSPPTPNTNQYSDRPFATLQPHDDFWVTPHCPSWRLKFPILPQPSSPRQYAQKLLFDSSCSRQLFSFLIPRTWDFCLLKLFRDKMQFLLCSLWSGSDIYISTTSLFQCPPQNSHWKKNH